MEELRKTGLVTSKRRKPVASRPVDEHEDELSDTEGFSGVKGEKRKRVQVPRACIRCAASKRKCNGVFPCDRCTRLGIEMDCEEVKRQRAPREEKGGGGHRERDASSHPTHEPRRLVDKLTQEMERSQLSAGEEGRPARSSRRGAAYAAHEALPPPQLRHKSHYLEGQQQQLQQQQQQLQQQQQQLQQQQQQQQKQQQQQHSQKRVSPQYPHPSATKMVVYIHGSPVEVNLVPAAGLFLDALNFPLDNSPTFPYPAWRVLFSSPPPNTPGTLRKV